MHAFRGMRGKKKSKLLTQLLFTCLANVQPQIQLKQCSETDMFFQDLTVTLRHDSFLSFSTQFSQALLLTAAAFQNASIPSCWWQWLQVQSAGEERTNVEQTVPSSLGAPHHHWGWLHKCSNCHQTTPQMEMAIWSNHRSLHFHMTLFGRIFKCTVLTLPPIPPFYFLGCRGKATWHTNRF